ncbi:MAG: hypothetical protein HC905_29355 [Bacteroidales bacterium]|nr:hypothetical protein [Bacteroidales bacterium]
MIFIFSVALPPNSFAKLTQKDSINKAEEFFKLAVEERNNNNLIKSRELALEAIKLNNTWGEPYLLIGMLYVDSYKICQNEALPRAVFCLAVDYFEKAKQLDILCAEKADALINVYKNIFLHGKKYLMGLLPEANILLGVG